MCTNPVWKEATQGRFYKNSEVRIKDGRPYVISHDAARITSVPLYDIVPYPCRKCISCCNKRRMQWGIRAMEELKCHEKSSFLTLTYSDDYLPEDGKLYYKHFQDFMKRLRKRIGVSVRYIVGGEYGSKNGRPHWHVCLFGWCPGDLVEVSKKSKYKYSPFIMDVWSLGFNTVAPLSIEHVMYTVSYCMEDGSINRFSLRPAIGRESLLEYVDKEDYYYKGNKVNLNYLENLIKQVDEERYEARAEQRRVYALEEQDRLSEKFGDIKEAFLVENGRKVFKNSLRRKNVHVIID